MKDELKQQLDRIERNTLLASKSVLCPEDVALLTGLSKSHLYKLTCGKQIPFYKPNGKHIYFDKSEVEAWMRQNRIATDQEIKERAKECIKNSKTNLNKK